MYTTIAAAYEAWQTVRRRAWWSRCFNAAWAALPLALGAAVVTAMHYVDQPPGHDASVVIDSGSTRWRRGTSGR